MEYVAFQMAIHNAIPFFLLAFLFLYDPSFLFIHSHLLPKIEEEAGKNTSKLQTYIVHVVKPDGIHFLTAEDRVNWHKSFLPSTHLESGEPRLIYSYAHAISGFAARLTPEEVSTMEDLDGFVRAFPDREIVPQTTYTPAFIGLNESSGIWNDSSYGRGVIIGVIDTGIFPDHPSFNQTDMPPPPPKWKGRCDFGPGACNNKLIGAMAFRNGTNPSPLDDHGHGTHVASTAAGNLVSGAQVLGQAHGAAVGIAPRAHIAVYKVLYNFRGYDSDFLAGIDQAIADGVDVLQMSLGLVSQQLYDSGVIVGSFAAIQHGVVPCAAAGNSGPQVSVIANDGPWVLTVGASTTDRRITATVKLGNGMELDGETSYQPKGFGSPSTEIVYPGANGIQDYRDCSTLSEINVVNKIVLCWGVGIGGNTYMGAAVRNAGGAAMIVMNDRFGALTTAAEPHVLPAAHVSSLDAGKILDYVNTTSNPIATIVFKGTQFGARPTPAVAAFSSRGPSLSNGGIIKPDFVAPGVNVLAAWPVEVGPQPTGTAKTFNFLSGTSMATPHVSGVAAMLKSIHPNWSPAAIKSAIMTTAYAKDFDHNSITDQYPDTGPASSVFAMGAGHVNPRHAADPGLIYDLSESDYIAYLCGSGFSFGEIAVIARRSINCSGYMPMTAELLNYPSMAVTIGANATKFISRTVTNVGEPKSVYKVKIDTPGGVTVNVSPDTLSFSNVDERQSFKVRFTATGPPLVHGSVMQGWLTWVSSKRNVTSPIAVTSS